MSIRQALNTNMNELRKQLADKYNTLYGSESLVNMGNLSIESEDEEDENILRIKQQIEEVKEKLNFASGKKIVNSLNRQLKNLQQQLDLSPHVLLKRRHFDLTEQLKLKKNVIESAHYILNHWLTLISDDNERAKYYDKNLKFFTENLTPLPNEPSGTLDFGSLDPEEQIEFVVYYLQNKKNKTPKELYVDFLNRSVEEPIKRKKKIVNEKARGGLSNDKCAYCYKDIVLKDQYSTIDLNSNKIVHCCCEQCLSSYLTR